MKKGGKNGGNRQQTDKKERTEESRLIAAEEFGLGDKESLSRHERGSGKRPRISEAI